MRVLLTGGAGFIGSHVLRALRARGDDVFAIVRGRASHERIVDVLGKTRVAMADLGDVGALDSVLASFRPEAVLDIAWYANPADYLHSSSNLQSLAATTRFAERVFSSGCSKLVGVGTCLEYARSESLRREDDPTGPESLYASCKLAAWLVCSALARQRGAEVAWARLFHVHGPGDKSERVIPWTAGRLLEGRPVEVSPGSQVRDQLHVTDVADGLVQLTKPGLSGVFNICSGVPRTLREILLTVGELVGRTDLLRFGAHPYPPGELMFLAGDPSRLRATGWAPRFADFESGLLEDRFLSRLKKSADAEGEQCA